MPRYKIVLADQDEEYISMLELRFLEYWGEAADIQLISDPTYFHSFFETPRRLDMLVLSDQLYSPALTRHRIGAIVRLSETPMGHDAHSAQGSLVLYKYTSMKELFAALTPCLGAPGSAAAHTPARLLCVYAPAGGTGTTTVAMGLAGALSHTSNVCRVFYLNTETIPSRFPALSGEGGPTPSFRSALLTGDTQILDLLLSSCGRAAFDYLLPFEHSITTYGITFSHFQLLAEHLRESGRYDFIVVDCSAEFTQEKSRLMSVCDRVVVLTSQGASACEKAQSLLRDINTQDSDRFLFVCNRYQPDRPNALKDGLLGKAPIAAYLSCFSEEICADPGALADTEDLRRLALQIL